jgi:PAS domain S-box-containing protein
MSERDHGSVPGRPGASSASRLRQPGWTPFLVLAASLLLVFIAAQRMVTTAEDRDRLRFQARVRSIQEEIVDRIDTYIALLRATRGHTEANDSITLERFRTFVASLDLDLRYPGVQGIGYSRRFAAANLPAFLAATRRELGPDFDIRPVDDRPEVHSIIYLEPLDLRNRAAIGYDMLTEPVRRTAMERARDTGQPAASGRVTLVQEIDERKQAGFLIYLPVYRNGRTPATVEERRALLEAFVYSPFRADDFLGATFGPGANRDVAFRVYAGPDTTQQLLLHDSRTETWDPSQSFATTTTFDVAGQPWSMVFATQPPFGTDSNRNAALFILVVGSLGSISLFALAWLQAGARANAEAAAMELRRSERALIASQERTRLILAHALDAVITMDREGRITSWNPRAEALFGWSAEEAVSRPLADLIIPESQREAHRRGLARYLATGEGPLLNRRIEVTAMRRDGHEFPVELAITPIGTNGVETFSAFLADITSRREAEQQMQRARVELEQRVRERTAELATANAELRHQSTKATQASRAKSDFLANMSHELRTPLNSILGFTRLMQAGKAGALNADQQEFLHDILASAQHLLDLVNDILDLARVESGRIELRPERLDPGSIALEVRGLLRSVAANERVRVDVEIDPAVGQVVVDRSRLRQVFYNYLSNALKFTPEGGTVTVRVRPEGASEFRVEVEDTGIGIEPEDISRLFVEFQQLDSTPAKRFQGTGLGLALTRRIVEAQGGRVGVRSTPGTGSVFHAVLRRVNHDQDTPLPPER